jgi:hypothetical protein
MGIRYRIMGFVCLALALAASPAMADTVFVSAANASGIEDGTAAYPFRTIARGIAAAHSGNSWDDADVVSVGPGIYAGYFYLKDFVKLVGVNPKTVHVGAAVSAPADVALPNLWIEGVTFTNPYYGIQAWNRVRLTDPSFWEVRDCFFYNNEFPVYARGAAFLNLTRCLFYEADSAIHLYGTSGITTVTHCTLARGTCENEGIGLFGPSPSNRVNLVNTAIINASYAVGPWGAGAYAWQVTAENCDFWPNTVPAGMARVNCISADPLYSGGPLWIGGVIDFRSGFQLSALSPCVDAGKDIGLPFSGAAPDIGPFESPYSHLATLPELLDYLATSYSDLDQDSLKSPSEQRRDAFCNKMDAVLKQYHQVSSGQDTARATLKAWRELRDKLTGDLRAKCDGDFGGNPKNDWIDDAADRAYFYNLINQILILVDKEIAKLGG